MEEIRKKIVASHIGGIISDDGHIQQVSPGWTWIVEPEGYAECIDVKELMGNALNFVIISSNF